MIRKIQLISAVLLLIANTAIAQHSKRMLSIAFMHYVDDAILQLDTVAYKNDLGQSFQITKFKYYITNIQLINVNGEQYSCRGSFLIDEDYPESKTIVLNEIPEGSYTKLSFLLGVDSAHNCSGAQSGDLDPAKGMFWVWNTGYIFLKIEGKTSASTAPANLFEYHIGGYKAPENSIRLIHLSIENHLLIEKNKSATLQLKVNAAEIFKNPNTLDFSKMPSVVDTKNAKLVADNYSDIFSILKK